MKLIRLVKIFFINISVLIFIIILLETFCYVGRILLKKESLGFIIDNGKFTTYGNPNNEFITHPFYGHTHTNNKDIKIRGGYVKGPFVFYDNYDDELPTILTLGGSTTDGVFQHFSNGYTWPFYLNEILKEKKRKFNIVNGGVGGYNTEKEFLKLLIDGRKLKNLKIVISLNGINDVENYSNLPEEISKSMPFYSDKNFNTYYNEKYIDIRNYWIYNFFPNIQSLLRLYSKINVNKIDLQNDFLSSIYYTSMKEFNSIDNWKFSLNMSKLLSSKLNIEYFNFLQPTMGLNDCQIPIYSNSNDFILFEKEMNITYSKAINELYTSLKSECIEMEYCYDISCVAQPNGNNYSDIRHHNENGNLIISEEIFGIIKSSLF